MSEEMTNQTPETDVTNTQDPAADEGKDLSLGTNLPEGKDQKQDVKDEGTQESEFFGKPESYDYKDIKLPEGMLLDEQMSGKFSEYASKLNLSQKGANDIMAMAVELTERTQKQTVEAMGKLQEAKIEGYKVLLNRDSEVGGAKLKESVETANIAYDGFFKDEELRVLLAEAGLTVHPKFIKALKAIGCQMKDDTILTGGQAAGKRNREDVLYPTMADAE